jgi:uncharacterized protein YdeI (YjbR/CyaY-like superfamily)
MTDIEVFVVVDVAAWREWLIAHDDESDGVWLALAKKGVTEPTSLVYQEALEEALCSGWIDGQKRSNDEATFLQRFTPRRKRSMWSARNVEIVERLIADARMRARGQIEIDAAQSDGRWDRAYSGAATAEVPDDLVAALAAAGPTAVETFATANANNRYAVLHRLMTATTVETRAARLDRLVAQFARGERPHPQ